MGLGRNVVVKQVRFKRLQVFSAEESGPALESQAAVDVDNRQDAADIAAALTIEAVEAVISGVYADFRPDVAPLVVEIPFDARIEYHAAAVLLGIVVKAGELAEYVELSLADMALPTTGQAGHDGIRLVFIAVLVGQRLVFLYAQRAVEAAAQQFVAVIEPCLTVEVDVARDVFAAVEVAVVIVVGNLVVVDAAADFAVQLLLVFPFELVAVVVDAFWSFGIQSPSTSPL